MHNIWAHLFPRRDSNHLDCSQLGNNLFRYSDDILQSIITGLLEFYDCLGEGI